MLRTRKESTNGECFYTNRQKVGQIRDRQSTLGEVGVKETLRKRLSTSVTVCETENLTRS